MENGTQDIYGIQESTTLKDYIRLIRANWLPVAVITLAGLIVAVFYALKATDIYKSTVALKISRHDGDRYRDLSPEVFQLCEIGWKDGTIQFEWPEEQLRTKPLRFQVRLLLAEIIKAFFEQPGERSAA